MRTLYLIVIACLMATAESAAAANVNGLQPKKLPPYLVVDTQTKEIRAAHDSFVRWAPASLTKLMTAYTVFRTLELQHLAMNSPVRMSEEAASQPPSKMGFPVGTILTVEAALKIIMVKSANDISVALAQAIGGSEENFVTLMNAHARRLGMSDSRFTNPHGLHHPDQFTSARDMAILTLALTEEFPQYADFFNIPAVRVTGRRLRNHNALLRLFDGTNGMKTGYICASGYNVIVRTKRKDTELAVVVFGGRSGLERNIRAARLLDESFGSDVKSWEQKLDTLEKPSDVSDKPEDITWITCPRKYAATVKPKLRPIDAPAAGDFDKIDTQLAENVDKKADAEPKIPVPAPRPPIPISAETQTVAEMPKATAEKAPLKTKKLKKSKLSLRELSKIYFSPRRDLRKDVSISLAGAVGPNPFGIKHTNGGVYKPPIPVPTRRPDLDLASAEE